MMTDTRTKDLSPMQAQRLTELRSAAAQAQALYQESVNVIALELVTSDELPRTSVEHTQTTIVATVSTALTYDAVSDVVGDVVPDPPRRARRA